MESGAVSIQQAAQGQYRLVLQNYQPPDFPESIDRDLRRWMEPLSTGGAASNVLASPAA
jgi:trimethylamine:corrinoid methyltransferase-like protein